MRMGLVSVSFVVLFGLLSVAQPTERVDLLLVDETQTLQASLMVQIYARALQETGLFNFEAKIASVQSSYDDPLGVNATDKKYELILIVPWGIEDGSIPQIWMITRAVHEVRPEVIAAVQIIRQRVSQDSGGRLKALSIMEDAALGIFASTFQSNGWLK